MLHISTMTILIVSVSRSLSFPRLTLGILLVFLMVFLILEWIFGDDLSFAFFHSFNLNTRDMS